MAQVNASLTKCHCTANHFDTSLMSTRASFSCTKLLFVNECLTVSFARALCCQLFTNMSKSADQKLQIDSETFERCRAYLQSVQNVPLKSVRDKICECERQLAILYAQVDALTKASAAIAALRAETKKRNEKDRWSDSEDEESGVALLSHNSPNLDIYVERAMNRIRSLALTVQNARELAATMEQALPETKLSPRISSAALRAQSDFLRKSPSRRRLNRSDHLTLSPQRTVSAESGEKDTGEEGERDLRASGGRLSGRLFKSKSYAALWRSPFRSVSSEAKK